MTYSWKLYKKRLAEGLLDARVKEALFVLGIDLGNHSSSLAFYDINRGVAEVIDISGGYGKPGMPTALQYVRDSREWVFGEYALLNQGITNDIVYTGLMEKLPRKEYLDVDGKPLSAEQVMAVFLKELLNNCRNINHKAEFAGITLAVPSYTSDESREAITQVFKLAGCDKPLISMDADRECIFSWYFNRRIKDKANAAPIIAEKVALLDFGARELRGGIYSIEPEEEEKGAKIRCISSLFDKKCGTDGIDSHMAKFLTDFYLKETKTAPGRLEPRVVGQIQAFAYQHKDLLFQQSQGSRPVKLYYNFVYPPIVNSVNEKAMSEFIQPHKERFMSFLDKVFKHASVDGGVGLGDISAVICAGGGFEMLWARNAAAEFFAGREIILAKNPKGIVAEGACIRSAEALGVKEPVEFYIEDRHMLLVDVGVKVRGKGQSSRFYPIAEHGSFWWQEREPVTFIYGGATGPEAEDIQFFSRSQSGDLTDLGNISLSDLPPRPPGTTRLSLHLSFAKHDRLTVKLKDLGFGELFPFADFRRETELEI